MDLRADPRLGVVAGDVAAAGEWQRHADGLRPRDAHRGGRVSMRDDPDRSGGSTCSAPATRSTPPWRPARALPAPVVGHRLLVRLPRRRDRAPSRPGQRRALRGHQGRQRAGGAAGPRRRRGGVHDRAARRRVRPGLAAWTILPVEEIARGRLRAAGDGPRRVQPGVHRQPGGRDRARGRHATRPRGRCSRQRRRGVTTREFFGHYARHARRRRGPVAPHAGGRGSCRGSSAGRPGGEVTPAAARYLARRGTYSIERARSMLSYRPSVGLGEGMDSPRPGCGPRGFWASRALRGSIFRRGEIV